MAQSSSSPRRVHGERLAALPAALAALTLAGLLACASTPPPPEFTELGSAEELYGEGLALLDGGSRFWIVDTTDYATAIERFQDIVDNYPYSDYAVLAELRIADAYFEQGLYEEALSYYRDFGDLHPGHERVPYTLYRAALSYQKRSHDPNRDQTATHQALEQLERLLREHPHTPEAREAETVWKEMRRRLGDHAMAIGDFYMEREEYQSAADRYRSVLDEYPGLGLDADALYKLGVCYGRMNLDDEATRIFQVILDHYEGSEVARAAEDLIPAAN